MTNAEVARRFVSGYDSNLYGAPNLHINDDELVSYTTPIVSTVVGDNGFYYLINDKYYSVTTARHKSCFYEAAGHSNFIWTNYFNNRLIGTGSCLESEMDDYQDYDKELNRKKHRAEVLRLNDSLELLKEVHITEYNKINKQLLHKFNKVVKRAEFIEENKQSH